MSAKRLGGLNAKFVSASLPSRRRRTSCRTRMSPSHCHKWRNCSTALALRRQNRKAIFPSTRMTTPSTEGDRIMESVSAYRPVAADLSQGDIFERIPLTWTKDEPSVLKAAWLKGGKQGYEKLGTVSSLCPGESHLADAQCDYARALLRTYDCEIDKPTTKVLILALIRPLGPVPVEVQEASRTGRKLA